MTTPNDTRPDSDAESAFIPNAESPSSPDERATQLLASVSDDENGSSTTAATLVGEEVYTPPAADAAFDPTDVRWQPRDSIDPDVRVEAWRARDPEIGLDTIRAADALAPDSDLALTSLDAAALSDLVAAEEAALDAERKAKPLPVYRPRYPMPPISKLPRGHLGSVLPAILLMVIGGWLTLAGTGGLAGLLPAESLPPDVAALLLAPSPLTIAGVIGGAVVISLLGYALGTGLWARGAAFMALAVIGIAVVIGLSLQPGGIDLVRGYPLLLLALAAALLLAGLLARPIERRAILAAVIVGAGGGVGVAFTAGYAPPDVLSIAAPFAPIVLAVVLLAWIAPALVRRNKR
jgi:hypothetical protein